MLEQQIDNLHDYEQDLWELEARQNSFRRIQQVFQLYALFGALIGIGALAYFFILKLDVNLTMREQMALMVSSTGFFISIFSVVYLFLRRQRQSTELARSRYMGAAAEFLFQWVRFEKLGRDRLEKTGREFNRMSIRAITVELLKEGLISSDELVQLEEVLRFRNVLVHSGTPPDPVLLARMSEMLRAIMKRIAA
ncbi:hypothetical protein [Comamonas koreensis]|uniref:DUF4145 domain-containing protein n=1 Tax=Comamonas koreensis TaxID=160825 RepID=A0AAW4XXB3_9BURK|nr:hypothetical protein [Comamonas koreensis]MCD2165678.1 hypothetical protein [Comamonas koreensis]